ncbi:MAG: GAF and ANTAR domain-containing protein [Rhodococcus sp. (in: high G+C Gram-positive bacteria)]
MDTEGRSEGGLTPARLRDVVETLGRRIEDTDQLAELLQRSVDLAHDLIAGAESCGVTIDYNGATYTACYTDATTLAVDKIQYETGEGPCLEASRTGKTIVVDCDSTEQHWPDFAEAARTEGVHSFLASPIRTLDGNIGSFNLYGSSRDAFDGMDADVLDSLTTTVGRAIGEHARFVDANSAVSALRESMAHRAPIEQAKGILMAMRGIDADAAFASLSSEAQRRNIRVRDVASEFVKLTTNPDGGAD